MMAKYSPEWLTGMCCSCVAGKHVASIAINLESALAAANNQIDWQKNKITSQKEVIDGRRDIIDNLETKLTAANAELAAAVKKVEDFDLVVVMNKKICSELDAAKARVAELEQQQFAGQTWVTFNEHMKALNKIKQMEDAIKFDFERFMEFQRRAEQAEVKFYERENAYVSTVTLLVDQKAELKNKLTQAEAQCAYWEKKYKELENGR